MTLVEIHNAIEGFEKLRDQQFQEYMYGVRKQCYWTMRAMHGKKAGKEKNIFPLDIDKEATRAKAKTMKPIEVIHYNNGQQSNG